MNEKLKIFLILSFLMTFLLAFVIALVIMMNWIFPTYGLVIASIVLTFLAALLCIGAVIQDLPEEYKEG